MIKYLLACLTIFNISVFAQQINFDAKGLILISDADMAASAFANGKLLKEKGTKDLFSTIKLPFTISDEVKSLVVSNSVVNWTKGLAISPNQKFAYVVESKSSTTDAVTEVKNVWTDLPAGGFITVVDITDLNVPKVLFKFPTGHNPMSVEVSPSGEYLAICTEEYGKELQVLELDATGKPIRIINKPQTFPAGRIKNVSWHPNGDYLAFTIEETKEIGLIRVVRDGPTTKIIRMDMVGKPVRVGSYPVAGQFTPDGKYYLIPDLKWGDAAKNETGYDGKGEIFVMRFNLIGEGEHFLLNKVKVGENPESFAISPDGSTIAVLNINKTFYPFSNPSRTNQASISLLKLADGTINKIAEYPFEGILPKSIAFDKNGENLAVSVYEYPTLGKHFGGVEFWKVNKSDRPTLTRQDIKFYLQRGVHTMRIVK
jgi:DNA-binding beta-propeller fold protein YncE